MNFVFISPNFPFTYWNFCDRLHKRGVNVLGIGDCPYDGLRDELKNCLTEYYKVDSLEDYSQVFRAVAYFSFKYGKIDWIESNNEYWLMQDARLREDFNVNTGVKLDGVESFKSKAAMKPFYAKAGVPTARQIKVSDLKSARKFVSEVGYPVIVKPEIGVGAAATYKLGNESDLVGFIGSNPSVPYVMEEFVHGDIYSYDAIVDSKGDPLFESSAKFPPSVMDVVNDNLDLAYCELDKVPASLKKAGRATVKAFGVKSRFVHFEFFRLSKDQPGLGSKGDFVGLEVNMRPAGGYTPDMMNFAHSTDVYSIWADMVVSDARLLPPSGDDHFCVYYGRRDSRRYAHQHQEIMQRWGSQVMMNERMPDALSPAMGNTMYTIKAATKKEADEITRFLEE